MTLEKNQAVVTVGGLLLVVLGGLALLGCVAGPGGKAERIYEGFGAVVITLTGVMMLRNHRSASLLCFVTAVLLTIDRVRQFVETGPSTLSHFALSKAVLRLGINVLFYWAAYHWYKIWVLNKNRSDGGPAGAVKPTA